MTQDEYIELLCNDLGLDTRIRRNAFISREFGREVKYLDELTGNERHRLVEMLKDRRRIESEIERSSWTSK
jgi:hypothetical protein